MSLKTEICELIAETVLIDREEVSDGAHLQDDLGADSLMVVELAESLGGRYGIALDADELVDATNVKAVVELVERRIAAKG